MTASASTSPGTANDSPMDEAQIRPRFCGVSTSGSSPSVLSPSTPISVSGSSPASSRADLGDGFGPSMPTR
ncbi:hypothetical protein ABZU75_03160 [Streptosporangium sp. NPDC005286]|uniref:hypothetical protein n=1 Tax=Streptosporangium sp. NPDC005286 TaxID=3154463 RepID=UPI0033BCC2A0